MRYSVNTGQYINERGRFIPRSEVIRVLDNDVNRTKARLKGLARRLSSGNISLPEFQIQSLEILRKAHVRLGILAAGGRERFTAARRGFVGSVMRETRSRMMKLGGDLRNEKISLPQLLVRMTNQAEQTRQSFYWNEIRSQQESRKNQAKRLLTPGFVHCDECITYERKQWTNIENIVPIGVACSCRGRCKCRIFYRAFN